MIGYQPVSNSVSDWLKNLEGNVDSFEIPSLVAVAKWQKKKEMTSETDTGGRKRVCARTV